MNQSFKYILAALLIAAAVAGYIMYQDKGAMEPSPSGSPAASGTPHACTMEAKICPDGTAVGRTGPNCEFAPCPSPRITILPPRY